MTKVLVIEDEASIRETIVDTLEFADYEVDAARNGIEGVKAARKFEPDLILCDVMMPELDGYGVLLELSQNPKLSHVPFIFLTAKATKEDMRRGMSLGADDYLTKPFTSQELLEAVKTRLDRLSQVQKYNTQQMEQIRQYINLTLPHELRTPLAGIMGYTYMLDGFEDMDAETIHKMIGAIKRSTTRLSNLIENYIAYGQVQIIRNDPDIMNKLRGFSNLKDFDTFTKQIADPEAYNAGRADDLTVKVESATVHLFFDHAKKLISEVINNAFKFSEKGTPVTVYGRVQDNQYVLSITNHGRGMTQEQIDNIAANNQFEREQYEQQGAGLGLAIAQYVMEIYGGELVIESQPGETTTVHIVLKLA